METVQEFALDIYNNLRGEDQQISGQNIELFVRDYTMQFLASLQKRAEGAPFAQAVMAEENDDSCQGRHERHIMNDRVSVDYDMSGDYNTIIEFLKKCTQKVHLPSAHFYPYLGQLSKYIEKYLQKRARKVA